MSNVRRAGSGGYGILSSALEAACEERDGLERELAEAREAMAAALDALAGRHPGGAPDVAGAQRALRAALSPEGGE